MKKYLSILVLHLCFLTTVVSAQPPTEGNFVIREAGQVNAFLDDDSAQVHVLLRPKSRLVFAFPAENAGMGLWFKGALELVPGSLRSYAPKGSDQIVEARFTVGERTVVDRVIMDGIRTLRDQDQGSPTAGKIAAARGDDSGKNVMEAKSGTVRISRHQRFLPSDSGDFELTITPSTLDSAGHLVLEKGEVKIEARYPFAKMARFTPETLYRPEYLASLNRKPGRVDDSLKALEFLARQDKMMAGSWRFLTYFGRDTLISAAMLEPILSDAALEAAIRSVLGRLSPNGDVAHEEDIGPWAEWRHLQAGEPASLEPVYDYKMIDDDLLLPVLLAKLDENGRGDVVKALLADPSSRKAILLNASFVLERLSKPKGIRLNPGESTGDWRDSHEGLGGGVYPASVDSDLALPTLAALETLYGQLGDAAPDGALAKVRALVPIWEKRADSFWVELSPTEVRDRLDSFRKTLTPAQQKGFDKLVNARRDLLDQPFRFPVLSFDDADKPMVIPHTDVAFTLFYGHPDQKQLEDTLTLLERPFPFGLATPAGHVVASPVFSTDAKHYKTLGFGQYHGLVVWSWPSAMLQLGLMRQEGRFPALDARIAALLTSIRESEVRVGPLATSELWAVNLDETGITWRGYGTAGDQAESNALQLWSTVYPALEYQRQRPRR